MNALTDCHTHHRRRPGAVINLAPGEMPEEGFVYSAGVHPWELPGLGDDALALRLDEVERLAAMDSVVAVGEAGIDRLRGGDVARQLHALRRQVEISERARKPLLLHVVRAYDEIIALRREMRPSQPWIVHGFRGKPPIARRLVDAGFYISLGEKFNPGAAMAIPPDRLLVETDESPLSITEIASRLPVKPDALDFYARPFGKRGHSDD